MKVIWKETKRRLGLPLSFTKYELTEDRLFVRQGILVRKEEQVDLFRVQDLSVSISLYQRIFGMGTVTIKGSDKSCPVLPLINVRKPYEVREILHEVCDKASDRKGVRRTEYMGNDGDYEDSDEY